MRSSLIGMLKHKGEICRSSGGMVEAAGPMVLGRELGLGVGQDQEHGHGTVVAGRSPGHVVEWHGCARAASQDKTSRAKSFRQMKWGSQVLFSVSAVAETCRWNHGLPRGHH